MHITKENVRAMIFYDYKSAVTPKQCLEFMEDAFGEDAPSKTTIYYWYSKFKMGHNSLIDEFRNGRPCTAITDVNISAVRAMIAKDNRRTYNEIQSSLRIGNSQVRKILHDYIGVRKFCCRWIPYTMNGDRNEEELKERRKQKCKDCLNKYNEIK